MQRRIYGHATDVEIKPLNEESAVQAASDLIGELFFIPGNFHFLVIYLWQMTYDYPFFRCQYPSNHINYAIFARLC